MEASDKQAIGAIVEQMRALDAQAVNGWNSAFSFRPPTLEDRIKFLEDRVVMAMGAIALIGGVLSEQPQSEREEG